MLEVGKMAPAFTLEDQDGNKVARADLAGSWVVLYFYPKDDTPGCTIEACEFSAGIASFAALDARVLGVSPDDAESHRRFRAKHDLEVELLSDPKHAMMERYEAWGEKNMYGKVKEGVIRSTVILDPEGRVAHRWKRVTARGHAEKVRARLQELRSAR
ncbi:MAG: peroxiredoxin [Planctomycetes bacterium]|nr:peroxiredoxin [Planctomycetota bacterium]